MPLLLNDIVRFRGDRLFNGAVNIGWFGTDETKSKAAGEAFVFHGPKYHGVQQEDVGTDHGHRLIDTAKLAEAVIRRSYGVEDYPFTLAIAGYGTGKSHFGLTLANLLSAPTSEIGQRILSAIQSADNEIADNIRVLLQESPQPCLVLALNGMQSFDLTAEITKQIVRTLKADGLDPKPLDDLRPRFGQAASLINMSNEAVVKELLAYSEVQNSEDLLTSLGQQDEGIYCKVHDFFSSRGMPIRALTGESVHDVIDVTVREYCGKGKPYRSLLILFDEFGKYTEFATMRSQIAGSGVLQDLFESVQANANNVCFVGFIQFELNAYVQRVAPEYKNEILRYITRYQSANKVYLSINLETLIASLLEKKQDHLLDSWFETKTAKDDSIAIALKISKWFPQSKNYRLWKDSELFHTVVRKGCWPLSAFSTWFLFYLTSAGKHLQERSALALLEDVFHRYEALSVPEDGEWSLAPVDLWSDSLQQELISSEETGQQGSITHAYASVIAKHGAHLSQESKKILCAVVLASKLGLKVSDREEALVALSEIAGLFYPVTGKNIKLLQDEYNVLEWDESFKAFDILGDAVPRTQFLSYVRQRVASSFDEFGKAQLFASKAAEWCDLLCDLECDFAEENKITTREWRYQAEASNLEYLPQRIKLAGDRWSKAVAVDEPRGTIIYTYVEPSRDPAIVLSDTIKFLRTVSRDFDVAALPILVVLLTDENGILGNALAELAVLEENISNDDRVRFGHLIDAHKEKMKKVIREQVDSKIKQRNYASALKEGLEASRLGRAGTELFAKIYKSPIAFPFDGFSTAKGNAADTSHQLTLELLLGKLDYEGVLAKPIKIRNRAVSVLKETWGIFTKNGDVSRRPSYPVIRSITEKWDDALATNERRLFIADALRQLCRPPYGGNIASAGLLLGVFAAPRSAKIAAVRDGQQLAIGQWVQDGVFGGKFIDLPALHDVHFISLGEASSEWETLLDEWELADSHSLRIKCLERAMALRNRIPVPPSLAYKEDHLHQQALASQKELMKVDDILNKALERIEFGEKDHDSGLILRGTIELLELNEKLSREKPLWNDEQIREIETHIERARQSAILFFKEWLSRQSPKSDAIDAVGDFKHKMLRLTGTNLTKLGMAAEFKALEDHTNLVIRRVESLVTARQLLRDVQSWLTSHGDAARILRVAEIRALKEIGNDYSRKLQGMSERVQMGEIAALRSQLSSFLTTLKEVEASLVKRMSKLWETKIKSEEDIETIASEIEGLVAAFENLPNDIADLQLMRRVLKLYEKDFQRLTDDRLSWAEFEEIAAQMKKEYAADFGNEELPWDPDETIDAFLQKISKQRSELSKTWIESNEKEMESIAEMAVAEASRIHTRLLTPPATITEAHLKRLAGFQKKVEARLETLNLDWLIEKYRALSPSAKKKFMVTIQLFQDL